MTEASPADDKLALRVRMRAVRAAIAADASDRARRSAAICDVLVGILEQRRASQRPDPFRVLLYQPLAAEPDLATLRGWCAEHAVDTYVPQVDGDDLVVDPGGLAPALLDAVVVPGLAFAADGRRLGQGGGHFDRFLPRLRSGCLRIGVAFAEQLLADVPTENHDARVDVVVTDRSSFWSADGGVVT